MSTTELATIKVNGKSLSLTTKSDVPDYLQELVGNQAGLDNVEQDDLLVPRLVTTQGQTKELSKKSENHIKDLKVGDFFNSVSSENYGTSITVIPLFFFRNYIKFKKNPDGSPAGVETIYADRSQVPDHELLFQADEKPVTTAFRNIMCLLVRDRKSTRL